MFKNMKLAFKIGGGFSLLLALVIIIASIGITSFFGVIKSVEKGDDANRIVKQVQDIRLLEKNYIMRSGEEYISEMIYETEEINKTIEESKKKLKDPNDRERMDSMAEQIDKYSKAFNTYIVGVEEKKKAEEILIDSGRKVEMKAEEIRQEQKNEYFELKNNKIAGFVIDEKLTKADDANRIIKWVLQCRRHEKNFQIREDKEYISEVEKFTLDIINLAENIKKRFEQPHNKQQADEIIKEINAYSNAFKNIVSVNNELKISENNMIEAARASISMATEARAVQKKR